jgi:acyl carrier protein
MSALEEMGMRRATASEIADWCIAHVARNLGLAPDRITPHSKFTRLGLDSAMSLNLILTLEQRLGLEISPELVFECPTIASLSEHLAGLCAVYETGGRSSA